MGVGASPRGRIKGLTPNRSCQKNRRARGSGGPEEDGDGSGGQRGRGRWGVWNRCGLEHRHTIPRDAMRHSMPMRDTRFVIAWVRGEEKAPDSRGRKRKADKAEVVPGVTV